MPSTQKSSLRWRIAQSTERRWWQNYLRGKDVEEYLAWKKNYWRETLANCGIDINNLEQKKILDAGCGPAGIFMALPHSYITAIDPLLDTYEQDLPHFNASLYPYVTFVTSSLEHFSSPQLFDYIFCMNAINHVQDIEACYNTLHTRLAPNGTLVVSIDAHNNNFFKKIFAAIPGDVLHPHQYNLAEYSNFLTSRKLKIITTVKGKKDFFFTHYTQVALR